MQVTYAVIYPSGKILQTGMCPANMLDIQGGDLESREAPEGITDVSHYWDGSQFVRYPDRPSENHIFDFISERWFDPRTPEEVVSENAQILRQKRSVAYLPKLEFILRVVSKGYISQAAGLQLLAGQIPEELIGLAEMLTGFQTFELQAKLVAASQIDRLDPFIQLVTWYMGMDDAQVDELFGITVESA